MLASLRTLACAMAVATCALGCDDLERFSTGEGEAYCGAITLGGAFRTGLSPRVQMRLSLDATRLDGPDSPGKITTYEAADGASPERRLLDGAELRPIPSLLHDPLSRLELGDGRERNAIFAVSPSDASAESLLAVVSLRSDGTVEVRLLRGGAAPMGDEAVADGRRMIFGIFPLERQQNECGF